MSKKALRSPPARLHSSVCLFFSLIALAVEPASFTEVKDAL